MNFPSSLLAYRLIVLRKIDVIRSLTVQFIKCGCVARFFLYIRIVSFCFNMNILDFRENIILYS